MVKPSNKPINLHFKNQSVISFAIFVFDELFTIFAEILKKPELGDRRFPILLSVMYDWQKEGRKTG